MSLSEPTAAAAPVGIRRSTRYLPEVESLRGMAIVLVYAFHLDRFVVGGFGQTDREMVSPVTAFIRAGHTGVSLFFVLSGFLLSLPFLEEAAGGKRIGRRQFYERRALRILPLYYVAVAVGTVLSATQVADLWNGVPYLFFLNSIAGASTSLDPYSSVWWSLATEAQFYVLLPLLPLFLRTRRGRRAGVALLALYLAAYGAYSIGALRVSTIGGQLLLGLSLFGRAPQFLVGIGAAWIYRRGEMTRTPLVQNAWVRYGGADLVLLLVALALGWLLRWNVSLGTVFREGAPYHAWHVIEALLWGAILLMVLRLPLRLQPLIDNRLFRWLGILSYSIYMWHVPIILLGLRALRRNQFTDMYGWTLHTAAAAACLTVMCVGVSMLTYRFIERPFLARKAHVEARS